MQNKPVVIAVVVTYNRLALLKECLFSLQNQTYELSGIIVVNNNSNDGTHEWLNQQNSFEVIHQENVGGAGGFKTGIECARHKNCDYIWVMDDDVEPELDCLENMIISQEQSEIKYDVLLPDRFIDEYKLLRWKYGFGFNFTNPFKSRVKKSVSASDSPHNGLFEISGLSFEGPMFKREVVKKVGPVDDRYYIIHDDTDYSLRVTLNGFRIAVCPAAILNRKIRLQPGQVKKIDFKIRYLIRNNIFLDKKYGGIIFSLIRNTPFLLKLKLSFIKSDLKHRKSNSINLFVIMVKSVIEGLQLPNEIVNH